MTVYIVDYLLMAIMCFPPPMLLLSCSGLESSSSMKPPPGSETMNYRKSSSQLKSRPRWDFSSVVTDMLKFYAEQVKGH